MRHTYIRCHTTEQSREGFEEADILFRGWQLAGAALTAALQDMREASQRDV
jgi:hypothetical protein